VAAMLKRRKYTKATVESCRRRSPIEIAQFYEPMDEEARKGLLDDIARAAKLQP
jgi:hypothetical protein